MTSLRLKGSADTSHAIHDHYLDKICNQISEQYLDFPDKNIKDLHKRILNRICRYLDQSKQLAMTLMVSRTIHREMLELYIYICKVFHDFSMDKVKHLRFAQNVGHCQSVDCNSQDPELGGTDNLTCQNCFSHHTQIKVSLQEEKIYCICL